MNNKEWLIKWLEKQDQEMKQVWFEITGERF